MKNLILSKKQLKNEKYSIFRKSTRKMKKIIYF